jgi:hypothetical protein
MSKVILHPRYPDALPLLRKYACPHYRSIIKRESNAFSKWLNETYPATYEDVKEGETFILWNGDGVPVPFMQMKDERPDKLNRPTRLLDGSYLSLTKSMRVCVVTPEECAALKKEILSLR